MKYCSHCGKELVDEAIVCPGCGCGVATVSKANPVTDVPNTGLNVISFLLPIVGLILYIMEYERAPKKAKEIGKWALIGFVIGLVLVMFTLA